MGLLKKEDIAAYLEKNDAAEFEINTKEEFETLKSNILENGVSEKIGDRISEIHSRYDADIEEMTGMKKRPEQKTYDFNKIVLKDLVADKENHNKLKAEFETLKTTKGKGDQKLADELEQVKSKALADKTAFEKEITDLKSTGFDQQRGYAIDGSISGLKQNENIPESVRKAYIQDARKKLIETSETREGKLVFLDENGKVILGKDYEVKGVNDRVKEVLVDILAKGKTGLGLKGDKADPVTVSLPDHVKDKNGLIEHMKTIPGLEMHSKKWDEMYKALSKNL